MIVNLCTKFRCDRSTNNEDNWGGGWHPPPKPKHVKKKPSPIRGKDTVQSQVISQQLFEQAICLFPFNCHLYKILHSLILMHDIWTKNFEKLLLVPKADCRKVHTKFVLYHTLPEFYKKMTLNMSKYELWS